MSGLKRSVRRMGSFVTGQGYTTSGEKKREKASKKQAALDKIYSSVPIPDEEEIQRNERRKASKRQGSRASTVLTRDTLG